MSLIVLLIALVISGLFWGALARLALPGKDPMTIPQTILVGIAGSLGAGLLTNYVVDEESNGIAFLLAVGCAALLVWLISRPRGRHGLRY